MNRNKWTWMISLAGVILILGACGQPAALDPSIRDPSGLGKADCPHCVDSDGEKKLRIGLTDTLYPQLPAIVEKLGGEPVRLVNQDRMQRYFGIPSPFANETADSLLHIEADQLDLGGHPLTLWKVKEYEQGKELDNYILWERQEYASVTHPDFLRPLIDMQVVAEEVRMLDGLLVGGGHDVNPLWYTLDKHEKLGSLHNTRDVIELAFIGEALRQKKPVLGICRGSQIFSVALGAGLIQDLPSHYTNLENRHSLPTEMEKSKGHDVRVLGDTTLARVLGMEPGRAGWTSINVNSYHHQAVDPASYLDRLEIGALDDNPAPDDNVVIEGWAARLGQFAVGVQWHPERPRLEAGDTETKAMFIGDTPERERLLVDPSRPLERRLFENFMTCTKDADACRRSGFTYY